MQFFPDSWPRAVLRVALIFLALFGVALGFGLWMRAAPGTSHAGPLPKMTPAQTAASARLEADVVHLATTIGPRDVSHPEKLAAAADHVFKELAEAGYQPRRLPYAAGAVTVENIDAALIGQTQPTSWVVVGGHYDSVPETRGADDNASGTAAMLEVARRLHGKKLARSVRFVGFVNEEPPFFKTPLMGSAQYANGLKREGTEVVAMLSLEMLGYYDPRPNTQKYPPGMAALFPDTADFVAFVGDIGSRALVHRSIAAFRAATPFPSQSIAAPRFLTGIDWSDHQSFWQAGYPALMITDTSFFRNKHYHEATDTPDTLDYDRMARVVDGIVAVVIDLAGEPAAK